MSKLPGYSGLKYRTHNGNYSETVDMEDQSLPLYAGNPKTPSLPVPDLDQTLDLFLQSVKPHVSPAELKNTEKAVEQMRGPVGRELHRRLLARAEETSKKRTSWFIDWWNQWAYLAYRDSVVHNVTYEILFKDECASAMADPTRRAARFIKHALAYRAMVAKGTLPPDQVCCCRTCLALCERGS
jgi:carnitine O-acetyltransferase